MKRPALLSIHDVMPDTVSAVQYCLDECWRHELHTLYLLIVPGHQWSDTQLEQLHQWVDQGCILAGHGWLHRAKHIKSAVHRLHSAFISRNVAEHLALDDKEIVALMQRCHDWFVLNELPVPQLYVPPAWALGKVPLSRLPSTGFRYVETLRGVFDLTEQRWAARPLLGYEADTTMRALGVGLWNRLNRQLADRLGVPRLAIHPNDFQLHLAEDLRADLHRFSAVSLAQTFTAQRHWHSTGTQSRAK